jgi:NADPH-dependent 2,4-dienoyl-CoA reductase/sulfur reductase-like enzyme
MGEGAGGMIKRWVEKKGIAVYTSTRVESIQAGAPLTVRLSNGEELAVDLLISAAGVLPNIGFLESSGIQCRQGVLTDERMQTNVAGVYAAGDCAEAFDVITGTSIVSAIQPNAADQAYCAGMNMAGKKSELNGVTQINVLDTLGLISTSFGRWEGVPGGEHAEPGIRRRCSGGIQRDRAHRPYRLPARADPIARKAGRVERPPAARPVADSRGLSCQRASAACTGNADRLRTPVGDSDCGKAERGRGHHRQAVRHAE